MGHCLSHGYAGGEDGRIKKKTAQRLANWPEVPPGSALGANRSSPVSATLLGGGGLAVNIAEPRRPCANPRDPTEQNQPFPLPPRPLEPQQVAPSPQQQPQQHRQAPAALAQDARKPATFATKARALSTSLSPGQSRPVSVARAMALGVAAARAVAATASDGRTPRSGGGGSECTPLELTSGLRDAMYGDDSADDNVVQSVLPLRLGRKGQAAWVEPAATRDVAPSPAATAANEEEVGPQTTVVEEGGDGGVSGTVTPCRELVGSDEGGCGGSDVGHPDLHLLSDVGIATVVAVAAVAAAVAAAAAAARCDEATTAAAEALPEWQWQEAQAEMKAVDGCWTELGDIDGSTGGGSGAAVDSRRRESHLVPMTPLQPQMPTTPQGLWQPLPPSPAQAGGAFARSGESWQHSTGGACPSPPGRVADSRAGAGNAAACLPPHHPNSTPGSREAASPLPCQVAPTRVTTGAVAAAAEAVARADGMSVAARPTSAIPGAYDSVVDASSEQASDDADGGGGEPSGGGPSGVGGFWTRSRAGRALELLRAQAAARAAEAERVTAPARLEYVPQVSLRRRPPSPPPVVDDPEEEEEPLGSGIGGGGAGGGDCRHPELSPAERMAAFSARKTVSERGMWRHGAGPTPAIPVLPDPQLLPTPMSPPQPQQPPRPGLLLLQQSGPPAPDRGLTHQTSLGHQARNFFHLMQQRRERAASVRGRAAAAIAVTAGAPTARVAPEATAAGASAAAGAVSPSSVAGVLVDRRMRLYPPPAASSKASALFSKQPSGRDILVIRKGDFGGGGSGGGFTAEQELLAPMLPPPPQQQQLLPRSVSRPSGGGGGGGELAEGLLPQSSLPPQQPQLIRSGTWQSGGIRAVATSRLATGWSAAGGSGAPLGEPLSSPPPLAPTSPFLVEEGSWTMGGMSCMPYTPQTAPLARARSHRLSEPCGLAAGTPQRPSKGAAEVAGTPHESLPGLLPLEAENRDATPVHVRPCIATMAETGARASFAAMLARIDAQVGPAAAVEETTATAAGRSGCGAVATAAALVPPAPNLVYSLYD